MLTQMSDRPGILQSITTKLFSKQTSLWLVFCIDATYTIPEIYVFAEKLSSWNQVEGIIWPAYVKTGWRQGGKERGLSQGIDNEKITCLFVGRELVYFERKLPYQSHKLQQLLLGSGEFRFPIQFYFLAETDVLIVMWWPE